MTHYFSRNERASRVRARNLRFESLETRELLSVSPADYAVVRENYPTLNLPEAFEEINIVEIDSQHFTSESLQKALDQAGETPQDDLIVLKSADGNAVFDIGAAALRVDVDSDAYGSTTLVSYGGSGASLISSSSSGAFDVVQGDFQLGGLLVVELGVDGSAIPSAGLQTSQVAFVNQTSNSSSETSAWSVDYATNGTERVFLTGLDETQAFALATSATDPDFVISDYCDADKTRALDNDEHICWAASASNILWYTGWGQTTPFTDEQNLFETAFINNFSDKAGSSYYASKWFITGEYPTNLDDTWAQPSSGGGYYQQAFEDAEDSVDAYVSHSNFLTSPSKTSDIATKLQSGYGIGLSVEWFNKTTGVNENAHSITLWGYSYDSSLNPGDYGYYTSLYFTDSDDYQSEERQMQNMSVSWRASCNIEGKYQGAYVLDGYSYNTSASNAVAAVTGATFLAQRPTRYASTTDDKPNLYPTVVSDGVTLLLTSSPSSTSDADTFLADADIHANFAFKSTQNVNGTVKCELWLDDELYATLSYESLEADQNYGLNSNLSLGKLDVGEHTLRLVIDSDSAVDENNENDNYFLRTFYVIESDSVFVTTVQDVVDDSDGETSLREAIALAGTSGYGSTIRFDSSLKGQTIKLSESLSYLYVQRAITIDASALWDAETNAPGLTIDAQGKSNAFCLSGGTESQAVKLVGLKIINGAGLIPTDDSYAYGGAIYALDAVELVDCAFESNKSNVGGAIYCYQGSLTAQNCEFNNNSVEALDSQGGLGGAIYLYESSLDLYGGSFTENSSVSSGAVFAYKSDSIISGTSFVDNMASQYAGAVYFAYGTVNISDSFFDGNYADLYAGALEFFDVSGDVYQSVFTNSTSGSYGGAVYVYSGSTSFTNCEFRCNLAESYGGAVFLHGQNQHQFSNCSLVDNYTSTGVGETLFVQYYTGVAQTLLATMRNCTITGDSVNAIYIHGSQSGIELYNSIVVGSSHDVYASSALSTVAGYNVLSSYASWTESSQTFVYDDSRPLFVDAASGDYRLAFQSQALDVGLDEYATDSAGVALEYDILGESRVICDAVDLGAYERALEATPEAPTNLTFGTYDADEKTIKINWNDNSDVEYYYLVEISSDGKEWQAPIQENADATSTTISNVEPGVGYYVRVCAANRAGTSACAFASRYVPQIPTAPGDVRLLQKGEGASSFVLWKDESTDESYFVVQVSTDGIVWEDYEQTDANVSALESTDALKYVRVAAGNSSGLSAYTAGTTVETNWTLTTTVGEALCMKLDEVDAETILWDFGDGDAMELENGAVIDPGLFGLTSGVSLVTAQYTDGAGVSQKATIDVHIDECSPSVRVESLPSVNANAVAFRINANFDGRTVERNWRVDWGDGTSTLYESTGNFFIAKSYDATDETTSRVVTLALLNESGDVEETFAIGFFTPNARTNDVPAVAGATKNESVFNQVFEDNELEKPVEKAIDAVANSRANVYGPSYLTDVFADCGNVVDEPLRKALIKRGFAF